MRQQQFIFATKADDPFVLGMRLWQMSVRYISQCLCSPHLLQRLAVCYLVLGWLFNRVWMMFQRRLFNLCNHFRTHSLATVHVGIIYSLLDCLSIYMFLITLSGSSLRKHVVLKGTEGELIGMWNHHLENTTVYWKNRSRFPAVLDVII
jgi:hypothetical protein